MPVRDEEEQDGSTIYAGSGVPTGSIVAHACDPEVRRIFGNCVACEDSLQVLNKFLWDLSAKRHVGHKSLTAITWQIPLATQPARLFGRRLSGFYLDTHVTQLFGIDVLDEQVSAGEVLHYPVTEMTRLNHFY